MHFLIEEYLAWVMLALAVVTFLFAVGAAFILLDLGLKIIVRGFHRTVTSQYLHAKTTDLRILGSTPLREHFKLTNRVQALIQSLYLLVISSATWHALRVKAHAARSELHLGFHVRHHKF